MKTIYRCLIDGKGKSVHIDGENLSVFKDGFWVTVDWKITDDNNGFIWIPPHRIEAVIKLEVEDGQT